jgi:hypothetical protein
VGDALLLWWRRVVGVVLQLSLCAEDFGYVPLRLLASFVDGSCVDLRGVDKMEFKFDLGRPFRPFEQLMGVLPVASKEHIPLAYQVRHSSMCDQCNTDDA